MSLHYLEPLRTREPGLSVVVIDDDRDMCRYLACSLAALGAASYTVCSGVDGVQKALELQPKLVVYEPARSGCDGRWVTDYMRSHPALRETFVLVLSGLAPTAAELERLVPGADAYLTKPADHFEFLGIVSQALDAGFDRAATPAF